MTNEERQRAIEWMKDRPVMMAGAKRMYDLAVEALEAYVPDMNNGNMDPSRESDTEITRCSDDTISRRAVIDKFCKTFCGTGYCGVSCHEVSVIEQFSSAQPRLIRCRDCYWWTKQEASLQGRCALTGTYPTGAFFCGNARQRPYPCNPEKNTTCSKTGCYINGGECRHTLNKEYAREEE